MSKQRKAKDWTSMGIPRKELGAFLDEWVEKSNKPNFIPSDPISIPHAFTKDQDIEIAAFFSAIMAWGLRTTILNKAKELLSLMDNSPHEFILNHSEEDLKPFLTFKHRTFQPPDVLYFIHFLQNHYQCYTSLQDAFLDDGTFQSIELSLINFRNYFISNEYFLQRTGKHIATPAKNSACKRLCMFLRWMVRSDDRGVDFGLWKRIPQSALICPCDVHVLRVSYKLGLLKEENSNWATAKKLTDRLREFDENDPVKYDFALYSLGLEM